MLDYFNLTIFPARELDNTSPTRLNYKVCSVSESGP